MSGKKSNLPDGRIPDRLPDGRPAVAWKSRWTEGTLPLWLVATAGGMAVIFVVGLFFYGSYVGVGSALPPFNIDFIASHSLLWMGFFIANQPSRHHAVRKRRGQLI